MPENLETVLAAARRLTMEQQLWLAAELLTVERDERRIVREAALAAVNDTHGTIKGLDRETIVWLAEDEELCGY